MVAGVPTSLDLRYVDQPETAPASRSSLHIYYRLLFAPETSAEADGVNQSPPLQWPGRLSAHVDISYLQILARSKEGSGISITLQAQIRQSGTRHFNRLSTFPKRHIL